MDQAMAIEHGMNGALGRHSDVAVKPPDQQLPDFARAPMRLVALQVDDQALDLLRQLVGIAPRPSRAVGQSDQTMLPVPAVDLVTCLAGYPELPAHIGH